MQNFKSMEHNTKYCMPKSYTQNMNEIITLYLRTLCDSNYFCDFFQFIILTYIHELKNDQSSSF